ncbi:hypothetical protein [Frankia sp. R82]|uniref:hypothetical protein n=1 Tax=Frankia sp. R82 TaxID=2950553 RepID=UPI0020435274|nr:hypothetical protein [Frankia sp. R82]MCM3886745.1 hypothetical protein [Frankia sp. R82]
MSHTPDLPSPAIDLIPGNVEFFAVAMESKNLTVILDRIHAQPAGFEFDLYALGLPVLHVFSPHQHAARISARAQNELRSEASSMPAHPALRCEIKMPGLAAGTTFPRVRVPWCRSSLGETTAGIWVRPLPPTGDAICLLTFDGLTGTAVLPGQALREAAATARPVGAPERRFP